MAVLWVFMEASFREQDAWQASRSYQRKPGKDLNGLITTIPMLTMLVSPAATLISLPKLSIGGKGDMTLIT